MSIDYRELLKKYMRLVWSDDFIIAARCADPKGYVIGEYSEEERTEMAALLAEIAENDWSYQRLMGRTTD